MPAIKSPLLNSEIDGRDCLTMIGKKCTPALRRWFQISAHVLRYRRFANFIAQFQEFPMDPWCTPSDVLRLHSADQKTAFMIHKRTARSATFPSPISTKSLSTSPDNRIRMQRDQVFAPVANGSSESNPERTVHRARAGTFC